VRRFQAAATVAAALLTLAATPLALAQDFPSHPIRVVIAFRAARPISSAA
jgi:tripartite-type tricarboxylate transporter receptor subunit TctC